MPKNSPRNAFYFFMLDFRKKQQDRGIVYNGGMPEVSEAAGKIWKVMPAFERQPFELMAKARKQNKDGKITKYTSAGEDVALVTKRQKEKEDKKRYMEKYIQETVESTDFTTKQFFVISCNHYCYCTTYEKHIPAELSIVKFTLKNGVVLNQIYHVIFDMNAVPMGYLLLIKSTSEATHQIPPPPHDYEMKQFSEKYDGPKTLNQILNFITTEDNVRAPVYVDDQEMIIAKDIIKNLLLESGYDEDYIKVYSLTYLFFCLRNAASLHAKQVQVFPYASLAHAEFERDVLDYLQGIACEFHDANDAYSFCTMSKAVRKIYIICDHCCQDLDIDLIAGKHVPKGAILKKAKKAICQLEENKENANNAASTSAAPQVVNNLAKCVHELQIQPDPIQSEAPTTLKFPTSISRAHTFGKQPLPNQTENAAARVGKGRGRIQN